MAEREEWRMFRGNRDTHGDTEGVSVPPRGGASDPKSLEELLLAEGAVSAAALERAQEIQRKSGAFLGEILAQEGILDDRSLLSFLTKHCKVPHLSLLDYLIDKEIVALLPRELCLRYRVLPLDQMGRNLTVAMVNPLDHEALAAVQQCRPELRVKPILCACNHFDLVARRLFGDAQKNDAAVLSITSLGLTPAGKGVSALAPKPPEPEAEPETPQQETARAREMPPPNALLDGDSLIQRVFRAHHVDSAAAPSAGAPEKAEPPSSIVMREMTSAMLESMRGTYSLLARRMELFRGIEPENVAHIFARGKSRECAPDTAIFSKGETGDVMYIILSGRVRIVDGERELAVLEQGDMFGEMALVSRERRSASAFALDRVSLLALGLDDLKQDLPEEVSVQLLINMLVTISARLRRANAR